MKAVLYLELVGYNKPIEEADGGETYIELIKRFDMPVTPFVGMTLQFPCIASTHPSYKHDVKVLDEAPEPVNGAFKVTEVEYHLSRQQFTLRTDYGHYTYRSIEDLDLMVEQLTFGYGFVRNDDEQSN